MLFSPLFFGLTSLMFISGVFVFCFLQKHLLLTLLSLEFMMLSVFFLIFHFGVSFGFDLYIIIVFLVFVVCEGCLGLGILVSLIRCHGNDYGLSLNSCLW